MHEGTVRRRRLIVIGLIAAAVLAGGAGFWGWRQYTSSNTVTIAPELRRKIQFPIYLPDKLPGTYAIDEASFSDIEGSGLAFKAVDLSKAAIVFTEQAAPEGFDFTAFYKDNLRDAKLIDGTGNYSTYAGTTFDKKKTVISVLTDKTWLLITTPTPLTDQQIRELARSLYAI